MYLYKSTHLVYICIEVLCIYIYIDIYIHIYICVYVYVVAGRWDARQGQEHVQKHRFFTVQIICNRVNNMCHVQGEWLADRMHGKGKYTYSTGKVYDGMWAEDRPVLFFSFFIFFPPYIPDLFHMCSTGKVCDGMWADVDCVFCVVLFFFVFFPVFFHAYNTGKVNNGMCSLAIECVLLL